MFNLVSLEQIYPNILLASFYILEAMQEKIYENMCMGVCVCVCRIHIFRKSVRALHLVRHHIMHSLGLYRKTIGFKAFSLRLILCITESLRSYSEREAIRRKSEKTEHHEGLLDLQKFHLDFARRATPKSCSISKNIFICNYRFQPVSLRKSVVLLKCQSLLPP